MNAMRAPMAGCGCDCCGGENCECEDCGCGGGKR